MLGEERIDWRLPKVKTEDLKESSVDICTEKQNGRKKKKKRQVPTDSNLSRNTIWLELVKLLAFNFGAKQCTFVQQMLD